MNVVEIADIGKPYLIAIGVYVIKMDQLTKGIHAPALMEPVVNFLIPSGYPKGKKVFVRS